MADVTVKVLTPASSFDFLTLEEAKVILGYDANDTSMDAQLQMTISVNSAIISEMCNRTFARETVRETWREVENGRVFLTHWPVKEGDIDAVTASGGGYGTGAYELEENSGKLSNVLLHSAASTMWPQSVIVEYTGGFLLPEEAPLPLKHATAMLVREDRIRNQSAQVAGIRQLSHKEARVAFFNPNDVLMKQSGSGSSPAMQAVTAMLSNYMRFWV